MDSKWEKDVRAVIRIRYRCEKSLDNVRQGKGQGTGRRGKIQQSILFLVIEYSKSLFSPMLILCNPKGVSSARVLGRRTGCILPLCSRQVLYPRLQFQRYIKTQCEHWYLTVQVRPVFSCLSPKHRAKLRRWEISYELYIQICNSINLVKRHGIHTSYISWDWNLTF